MKNTTLIGSALLGTWSSEVKLSKGHDHLTAYFLAHFMADPRKGHSCTLEGCSELNNQVCVVEEDYEGYVKKLCLEIANEKDVSWSDLNVFFYFGVKIDSKSNPKAQFELSSGDWIGPFNLIMAQQPPPRSNNATNTTALLDRYVARYAQSQSIMPPFLQNQPPLKSSLYTRSRDYATILGNPALNYMTQTQTNYSINATTSTDPYALYVESCNHGDVQPILPLLELEFSKNNTNTTAFRLHYKVLAVPLPNEQAYRVLPQLQSKFQGQGEFNILGGPYCYGNDTQRGHSIDFRLDSQQQHWNRGCLAGYPCAPLAAMGGLPTILPAPNNNHTCPPLPPNKNLGVSNVVLLFVAYSLGVALLISLTFQFGGGRKKKQEAKNDRAVLGLLSPFEMLANNDARKPFGGLSDNNTPTANQSETVNPFGDLDPAEEAKEDPLKEPLLTSASSQQQQEQKEEDPEEAK